MSRFSGVAGEDYELSRVAISCYDDLQKVLSKQVVSCKRVLELGCGTGITTAYLVRDGVRIVAVDHEPVMLSQARKVLSSPISDGVVELVEDDILSYLRVQPARSFDAVVSCMTLHNLSSDVRHDIHDEILRVLTPSGLFVNADKYAQEHVVHQENLSWQFDEFKRVFSEMGREDLIDVWVAHYLSDEHPDVIMREEESIIELEELGFVQVEVVFRNRLFAVVVSKK